MGMRDEMLRGKVLVFMIPLLLPIGQPPATATDRVHPETVDCEPWTVEGVQGTRMVPDAYNPFPELQEP